MGIRAMRSRLSGGLDVALVLALIASAAWYVAPGTGHSQPADEPPAASGFACARPVNRAPQDASFVPLRAADTAPPAVGAASAVAIDATTGRVLYDKQMHEQRRPASTTKVMTAIVALETMRDENEIVVSATNAQAMVGSSVMGLWADAPITYRDLLYGLMLPSGNDAALELARNLAPSVEEFVEKMNAKAAELGLRNTHFRNPHGLDRAYHFSSAYDLAMIARYAMQNVRFREIAAARQHHLSPPFDYDVFNGNSLLDSYPGALGVKIGWTNRAGWTFVAAAQRHGREVIVALMNTPDRDADAAALLDWSFATFEWREAGRQAGPALRFFDAIGAPAVLERWFASCLASTVSVSAAAETDP